MPVGMPRISRDLGGRQADVVREDEHRAVLDGQFEEGPLDLVAIGDPGEVVARIGSIDRGRPSISSRAAGTPRLVGAGVDEEAMEPGVEPARGHADRGGPARHG